MKTYSLIKKKAGERRGVVVSTFFGESSRDEKMLTEIKQYIRLWLDGYNNSLTSEEVYELFRNFDGNFSYDVWSFSIEERK